MKTSQLNNYTNPEPLYNCPHFAAQAVAARCQAWGLHNLREGFRPPKVLSVVIRPVALLAEPAEPFEPAMFLPEGFLHEVPLNHYVALQPAGTKGSLHFNAGYLMYHFILSEKLGYAELGRLLRHAPTILASAPGSDTQLQTAGPSPERGVTGDLGGDTDQT